MELASVLSEAKKLTINTLTIDILIVSLLTLSFVFSLVKETLVKKIY